MFKRNIIYGFRLLLKSPGFSIIAILTLALGIGAVTTQFSVVNGVLFKGLPFPDNHELVHLERVNTEREFFNAEVPILDFLDWEEQQTTFDALTPFFFNATVNVTIEGTPHRYDGSYIWHNFTDTLQEKPILGPGFSPQDVESGAPMRVIIGYGVWQGDFGGNPNVIGKEVVVNGKPGTIAGVMGRGFEFPMSEEIWVPLTHLVDPSEVTRGNEDFTFEVVGRLKDGVTPEQASLELSTVMQRISETYPDTHEGFTYVDVRPFIQEFTDDDVISIIMILLGAVFLVLGIACVNVANLLLARSALRVKEVAIRSALGASRRHLIFQMLTESLLIAVAGAIGGVILSLWALDSMSETVRSDPNPPPFWINFSIDNTVLIFVTLIAVASGVISGLIPAFRASRTDVNAILKENTRGGSSLSLGKISRGLVIMQIAFCCLLLIFTALFVKSINNVMTEDYGVDLESFVTARAGLFPEEYPDVEGRVDFYRRVIENLQQDPRVGTAAVTNRLRFRSSYGTSYLVEGETYNRDEAPTPFCRWEAISPDYFNLLDINLIDGRMFTSNISPEDPREIVINQSMAAKLRETGSGEVLGRRLAYDFDIDSEEREWWTVVGVVPDLLMQGAGNNAPDPRWSTPAGFYRPLYAEFAPNIRFMTIIAKPRNPADLDLMGKSLREAVQKADPNIPLYWVDTPKNLIASDQVQNSLVSNMFIAFGLIALALSAIGLYGVISFGVNQRVNEIGVRMALGANGTTITKMILSQGMTQLLIGLSIGLFLSTLAAYAMTTYAGNILYQVNAWDFGVFLLVSIFLCIVALLSTLFPALRAARVQPMQALRYE